MSLILPVVAIVILVTAWRIAVARSDARKRSKSEQRRRRGDLKMLMSLGY